MNITKRKLNKIKVRKDNSRKQKHLRKNKKKFDNSKKKHNRKSHLKNKTLKIYFGGANEDCQYLNSPETQNPSRLRRWRRPSPEVWTCRSAGCARWARKAS